MACYCWRSGWLGPQDQDPDGKTSSEIIKDKNEFHLVDSSGHVQIPNQIIEGLGRKIKFSNYKDGKVILESDE